MKYLCIYVDIKTVRSNKDVVKSFKVTGLKVVKI